MSKDRLVFLQDAFLGVEFKFTDDFSSAVIMNPNYDENITVYDEEFEYIVCFSFQHRHFEDKADVVSWIQKIISGKTLAIEFFNHEQRVFGGEIDADALKELSYHKLERFTGHYSIKELLRLADSFKIRGWDSKNNLDCTITCDASGNVVIGQTFLGIV